MDYIVSPCYKETGMEVEEKEEEEKVEEEDRKGERE